MRFLNELHEGDRINGIYLCKQKQSAVTKNGKPYENIILQDKTGIMDGKIWDPNSLTPIYLFDEATSNVDAESENDIMQAIHSLAGKKTIILISHRLANVVHSDCIYAMSNGRVIEQGTHAQLLAKQGAYSRLYLAQRQLETLEEEDA